MLLIKKILSFMIISTFSIVNNSIAQNNITTTDKVLSFPLPNQHRNHTHQCRAGTRWTGYTTFNCPKVETRHCSNVVYRTMTYPNTPKVKQAVNSCTTYAVKHAKNQNSFSSHFKKCISSYDFRYDFSLFSKKECSCWSGHC